MRRLVRFVGRTLLRVVIAAAAVLFVAAPVAAFTARDVDGPWTPVNGVCYRRVERVAFNRITIDKHWAIGSMRLCEEAADTGG